MNEIVNTVSLAVVVLLGYGLITFKSEDNSIRLNLIRYKSYELTSSIKTLNYRITKKGTTDQETLNKINQYSNDLISLFNEYKESGGSRCIPNNEVNNVLESIRRLNIAIVNMDNLDPITANGIDLIDRLDDIKSRVEKCFREGDPFLPRLCQHFFTIIKQFNIIQLVLAFCFGGFVGYFRKRKSNESTKSNESNKKLEAIKHETEKLINLIKTDINVNKNEILSARNNLVNLLSEIYDSSDVLYKLESLLYDKKFYQSSHNENGPILNQITQNAEQIVKTLEGLLKL